jgi:hypothetical protein
MMDAPSRTGSDRVRRRRFRFGVVAVTALAVGVVVVGAVSRDNDSDRSGRIRFTSPPLLDGFVGCGAPSCVTPAFMVSFWDEGQFSEVDVRIVATAGCLDFGDQTRTYPVETWTSMNWAQGKAITWVPTEAASICVGSTYDVYVRGANPPSGWTSPISAVAGTSDQYPG